MTKQEENNRAIEFIQKERYRNLAIYYSTVEHIEDKQLQREIKKELQEKVDVLDYILLRLKIERSGGEK